MSKYEKVIVTLAAPVFLGQNVVNELKQRGYNNIVVPRSREYDLTEQAQVRRLIADVKTQLIIHLAAVVGGIGANRENPGKYSYDN